MINNKNNKPHGLTCLQTDDTVPLENQEFAQIELKMSKLFESNTLKIISKEDPATFNNITVTREKDDIQIDESWHIKKLAEINQKTVARDVK